MFSKIFERQKFRRKIQRKIVPALAFMMLVLFSAYVLLLYFEQRPRVLKGPLARDRSRRTLSSATTTAESLDVDEIQRLLGDEDGVKQPDAVLLEKTLKPGKRVVASRAIPIIVEMPIVRLLRVRRLLSVDSGRTSPAFVHNHDCHSTVTVEHPRNISEGALFPADVFSMEERRHGAILLHLAGLIYMFVALAIVCDEFFVPSLSVLTESLSISDDVAGATFMAAGGSAPEFFTSLFGVFITQNNVGIGTIVGSATFNILCVLAFCTLFSREVLQLTWWPLFRDLFFYIFALLCLVVFFVDDIIEWHEALTMFLVYIIYGIIMKYNEQVEAHVKGRLLNMNGTSQAACCFNCASVLPAPKRFSTDSTYTERLEHHRKSIPVLHSGAFFRSGITTLALEGAAFDDDQHSDRHERSASTHTLPVKAVQVMPAVSEKRTPPSSREVRPLEVRSVSGYLHTETSSVTGASNGLPDVETPSPVNRNGNNGELMKKSPHVAIKEANGHCVPTEVANGTVPDKAATELPPAVVPPSSDIEKPVDMSWPSSPGAQLVYLCLAPIMFPLYITLPDTKKPSSRKFFVITFIGSILWIAFFSYLMVWWASTIGETLGIPTEIMGLTILAAGTSIPDLITSVIVARKGLGDMAVSSSIGSNLFDICVGLPVPWLLHFSISFLTSPSSSPTSISVSSRGLICSVGILFLMLLVLVLAIAASGWQMNKHFGVNMILAYLVFCVFSVLLETGYIVCPLRPGRFCR